MDPHISDGARIKDKASSFIGRDKSAELFNCPHEDISKSHSVAP